jgi:hypothetical protein
MLKAFAVSHSINLRPSPARASPQTRQQFFELAVFRSHWRGRKGTPQGSGDTGMCRR